MIMISESGICMRDDAKRSNAKLQMEGLSIDTDKDDAH